MAKLDPIVSEFATQQDAHAYDKWFREQVEEALREEGPGIPHEQVMSELREIIRRPRRSSPADGGTGNGKLDPLISEFETQAEADAYDTWFRAKVEAALRSTAAPIPHAEVRARTKAILDRYRSA